MTEKFVRDCDNVTDIKKVDFIMARQSDLIHTTDGKEWVMNNGKPEQISGAVVSMGTAENENKDVQVTFNANKNGTPSKVGSIIMGGNGFEYDSDKSIIHNKGVNSVSGNPSSTVGSGTDGSVYFERTDTTEDNVVDVLGQINFKSTDFVVTTEEQSGTEVINVSTVNKGGAGALTPFHFVAHTKGGDAMDVLDFTGYGIVIETGDATKTLTIHPSILSVEAMATADYTIDPSSPLGLTFKSIGDYDLNTINDIDMFATATHIDLNVDTNKFVPMYFNLQYMNNAGMINDNLYINPDSAITITAGQQGQTIIRK